MRGLFWLSDDAWAAIEPHLPKNQPGARRVTPADVYHGRGAQILKMREEIKEQTIRRRRLQHQSAAA